MLLNLKKNKQSLKIYPGTQKKPGNVKCNKTITALHFVSYDVLWSTQWSAITSFFLSFYFGNWSTTTKNEKQYYLITLPFINKFITITSSPTLHDWFWYPCDKPYKNVWELQSRVWEYSNLKGVNLTRLIKILRYHSFQHTYYEKYV